MVGSRPKTARRSLLRALISSGLAVAGTLAFAPGAWAHGGEGETEEGYVLVQQALGHLAHEGALASDAAMEKVDDALATTDQEGVDVALVQQAEDALKAGDVSKAQDLLQRSIAVAVSSLKPAVGEHTGTSTVLSDLPGRGPLTTLDWGLLGISALIAAVGAGLAVRLRPPDTLRALRTRLGDAARLNDQPHEMELR